MTPEVETRLKILGDSGLITPQVAESCREVSRLIEKRVTPLDDGKFIMFLMHLAMAMQRCIDGKEENPIGKEVMGDVKEEAAYLKAEALSKEVLEICPVCFPETEKEFLLVHLCNLLS